MCYKKQFQLLFLLVVLFYSCEKEENTAQDYNIGKNRFTLEIDGDVREFYVHVPTIYDPEQATPVVFMLHGTSGDGERFYNISGWKEVGEVENILTVFPSSWHHCVIDDGEVKHTTKWNVFPGSFSYCAGEEPRDDIGFLREIIADLQSRFNVDDKRIYVVGFSNGGQMAARCAVEMSDVLAAVCENAGGLPPDTTCMPLRFLPVLFQMGNSDDRFTGGMDIDLPMDSFDILLNRTGPGFEAQIFSHVSTFQLDTTYTITGSVNTALRATYTSSTSSAPERVFHFVMVIDLDHQYPNGTNHWMHGAEVHWEWMKEFALP